MSAELSRAAEVAAFKSWLASLHEGVEPQLIDCWLAARRATAGDAEDAAPDASVYLTQRCENRASAA